MLESNDITCSIVMFSREKLHLTGFLKTKRVLVFVMDENCFKQQKF